jgi:hypothetical protein
MDENQSDLDERKEEFDRYVAEQEKNGHLVYGIVQKNRHRSCPPFEWFGPLEEPNPHGEDCACAGCYVANWHKTVVERR